MQLLSLIPRTRRLEYAVFTDAEPLPRASGEIADFRAATEPGAALAYVAGHVGHVDAIALRLTVDTPRRWADNVALAELGSAAAQAPLHLPGDLELARACRAAAPDVPLLLVSSTSFFAELPARERHYALPDSPWERRGYHGLYHGAVGSADRQTRIVSVCLEPRPEVAGIRGRRPLTVSSGATPLEGLPGDTACGDLDPSIVTLLAAEQGWGPERLDRELSRNSGLSALVGHPTTLPEVLVDPTPEGQDAAALWRHHLLLAAGAAAAVLGGVDRIVFSGRYVASGRQLGPWLAERLSRVLASAPPPAWELYERPLPRLLADILLAALPVSV